MKEYYKFLGTDLLSQFSSGLLISSISWYSISKYSSNELVANLTNVNLISGLLITVLIIPLIDRYNSRSIIKFSQICKLLLILIGILFFVKLNSKFSLYILALANGIGWNIYFPASKKLIQSLSNNKNIIKNNAFAETTMQIGLFSSGLISGILLKYFNILITFGLIFFLSFIAVLLAITLKGKDNYSSKDNTFKQKYKYKFVYIFFIGIVLYIPFVGANEINTILPGYVNKVLNGSSITYGTIDMMYGVGATIAGFLVAYLARLFDRNTIVWSLFTISIFISLILTINHSPLIAYLLLFILGAVGPSIRILINSFIMTIFPKKSLGKLMSIWNLLSLIIQIFIIRFIGITMDAKGPKIGFLILSLTMLLGLIISFFVLKLNKVGKTNA